jgi:hypothetical protein
VKRLAIIVPIVVLGVGLWGYRAYQKSLLEQEDAEIWSNVKASTAASEQWNADTDASLRIELSGVRGTGSAWQADKSWKGK